MKRLTKYMVVVIVLFSVVALMTGCCGYEQIAGKVTGGGWFDCDSTRSKCTFGFNAQGDGEDFKGQFQFNDHAKPSTKIHAEVMTLWEYNCEDNTYKFVGEGELGPVVVHVQDNGQPGADEGDEIKIEYDGMEWEGELGGGNIKIH